MISWLYHRLHHLQLQYLPEEVEVEEERDLLRVQPMIAMQFWNN